MNWERKKNGKPKDGNAESSNAGIQKASTPAYQLYRLAYHTGNVTIAAVKAVAGAFKVFWNVTLSEAFEKAVEKFRHLSEFKQSRAGRGEYSIARLSSRLVSNTAAEIKDVALEFLHQGPVKGFGKLGSTLKAAASRFWSRNKRAFSYLAPALGVLALLLTINYLSQFTFALSVSYNGRAVGVINKEQEFRAALYQVETNVTNASGHSFTMNKEPQFKTVLVRKSDFSTQDNLYDSIIMASSKDVFKGYGLYVDNRLVGANTSGTAIQALLAGIIKPYESDPQVKKVEFVQDVQIKSGIFPSTIQKPITAMKSVLTAQVENKQNYKAQKGDTPIKIASLYHLSVDQLYAMNPSLSDSQLTEGQTVLVKNPSDMLKVKIVRNEVFTQSIAYNVQKVQSDSLYKGQTKVQTQGQNGEQQIVASVAYVDGTMVDKTVLSTTVTKAPVDEQDLVGTKDKPTVSTFGYNLPPLSAEASATAGGLISYAEQYLGVRYRSGGSSPSGFDCSGFTSYVYSHYGIGLSRSASGQFGQGTAVSRSSLQSGDLVFFDTDGGHNSISHVGMYIGGNMFIQASSRNPNKITITSLSDGYWSPRYMGARRVLH